MVQSQRLRSPLRLQPTIRKTNAAETHDAMAAVNAQTVAIEVNAADVTAAVVVVAATNAVIVLKGAQKVDQTVAPICVENNAQNSALICATKAVLKAARKAEAMSGANAAQSNVARSSAASNAMICVVKARNRASHAHPVSHASHAKAGDPSAHVASVLSAQSVQLNNAQRRTASSKTSPLPTRPPWLQLWVDQAPIRGKRLRVVNAASEVAAATAALSRVLTGSKSVKSWVMLWPRRVRMWT